ncbi:MAG: CocE/NonD family hydrolase [Proteobacteria bacterium]|nr:CocE/NonD family hydrolase [Pseudomonadota bacterium]
MQVIDRFPRDVEVIDNLHITLKDGCRLAARMWLPVDAAAHPVPAILEYLPYRKRDATAQRDALTHPYFAGHGYASIRVDMRGSGESDGILDDEYLKREQDDALEVIRWIARQTWCTGAVGMMGISWGGFNALQVAARRPPALKAIITLCSTDDRYADDVHYMGGSLLNVNLVWATTMLAYMSRPPDPALVGERWRSMWQERLAGNPLLVENWLRHQRRDAYWKHGSVCEDFEAIRCPVYAIGGWMDAYSNAVLRLLAGLKVPRKGLIGPWGHKYPHFAKPEPAIDFLGEALRWWDHWLKGQDTGIMAEPMLRAWMLESVPPRSFQEHWPGRWIAEDSWPGQGIETRGYALNEPGLASKAGAKVPLSISSPQDVGADCGEWSSMGTAIPDLPTDQRFDDAGSLVFDSPPLSDRVEILGAPILDLVLSGDRPQAQIAVRLNDVAPNGAALRMSYGILNLTHRSGHEAPLVLQPGRRYRVRVVLNDIAYALSAGHRLRIAVSTGYWPTLWPSPEPVTLTVMTGVSRLSLPVRTPKPEDARLRDFGPARSAAPERRTALKVGGSRRVLTRDLGLGWSEFVVENDTGVGRIEDHGLEVGSKTRQRYRIRPDDPLSAEIDVTWSQIVGRGEWQTRTETRTVMSATRENFLISAAVDAYEGGIRIFTKSWNRAISRHGV